MSGKGSKTSRPCCHRTAPLNLQEHTESFGDIEHNSYSDEETSSDDDYGEWSPDDGICPSTSQFNAVYQASYNSWRSSAWKQSQCGTPDPFRQMDAFLDLLQDVPAFFHNPPTTVDVIGRPRCLLTLRSSLQIGTTEEPSCEQRWKSILHFQYLAFPVPKVYKAKSQTLVPSNVPHGLSRDRSGYLTSITLAWSYVTSCRWVEILQCAGEKSSLWHGRGEQITKHFWDLVIRSRWMAQVNRKKGTFYPPWMLREENDKVEKSCDMIEVSPNSSVAFDILLEFCASEGLDEECFIGLATVLMLMSRNAPPPTLTPPSIISRSPMASKKHGTSERLFRYLDKFMSVSSTNDALDSLLCSVFFDPCVPCNLVGAVSLGITEALLPVENDYQRFLEAIAHRRPDLSFFWVALVRNGQAKPLLSMSLKDLPPLSLVAALWTNTVQSFLQVTYQPSSAKEKTLVPRSCEFRTSYFCRPEALEPWTPAPPFGSTGSSNLSLEVRQHYNHEHRPLWWRSFWTLRSGDRVPASSQNWIKNPRPVPYMPYAQATVGPQYRQRVAQPEQQKKADEQSYTATSRLFNWHRGYDDGLWLEDGIATGKIEAIRKLQQHPWIVDPFDDGGESDPVDEEKQPKLDRKSVLEWITRVEQYRRRQPSKKNEH